MGTRVFLVRHGATEFSAEDRFAGETDVALSDEGRTQARKLGERLAEVDIAAAYASPMGRTIETATLIVQVRGMKVTPVEGLREISHGEWEGHTRAEVETPSKKSPDTCDQCSPPSVDLSTPLPK